MGRNKSVSVSMKTICSDSHSNSPDYWTSSITALIADAITFVISSFIIEIG